MLACLPAHLAHSKRAFTLLEDLGTRPKVIATGGLAELMAGVAEAIEAVEPDLTLEGLRLISCELHGD